ncbi:hypothetical protein HYH02_008311 [Chlamydomonas schloesseri]|uniref:ABC transporter n=1 Tax=Chlamydomonas schloesseri TaxID=2026947 RepID=A0A836B3P1_9CHLO|nr:hypothetical protein HYH02_008311 [Chlamydomonas schloesseri]|eukprot:KAG2446750.1 hypothetical protein HYH02_008311 [Chlamydomonas schloesseri]
MAIAVLVLLCVVELATTSWCSLWPLRSELSLLLHAQGWSQLYSFSLGNLDVLILAVAKQLALLALILATPSRRRARGGGAPLESNHQQVRTAIGVMCLAHATLLLVKAAAVAVTAPDDLWPAAPPHPPGGAAGGRVVVGLVYMYASIVVSLLSSLLTPLPAGAVVEEREAAWEEGASAADAAALAAAAAADPLRAPLLAAAAAEEGAAAAAGAGGRKGGQTAAASGAGAGAGAGAGGGAGKGGAEAPVDAKSRRAAAKRKQRTLLELLRLSAVDTPLLLVAFSAGVVAALGSALLPFLTGKIINYAAIEQDRTKFGPTALRLLAVAGLTAVFTGVRGGLFTLANTRLNVRLRKQLFHSLLQFEVGFFDTTKTGEITSRLAADTSTVADQVGLNLNVMLRSATQAAMVLVFMFAASWRLTVVTFILVPVVLTISKVYGRFYSRLSKRVQAELAAANGVAEEVLSTMTTVKAHAAQDSAEVAYAAKLADFYKLQMKEAGLYTIYAVISTFLPNLTLAAVLFYGGHLVLAGLMAPPALVSFMLYQQSLTSAFQMIGDVFSALTAAVGAADKVIELMKRTPDIPPAGRLVLPALEGRVELRDVSFSYPARPHVRVLNGLSLVAQPGEVVALVGASGGGKSSIVKLLERFYLPTAGRILIDGRDLGDLDPKWLRRQVALVSQEPVLYARSIRRNIIFGLEKEDGAAAPPTEEEIVEAAKQANAHDFITSFPEGYDTCCGEKGVALSGGQKQRIAIARALVRKPRVLLLDEATSALDADSEAVVQEALDRVMAGRTVLVIAHRLSTIQNADRIYVVGKGLVQEVGTHDELLAAGGVYAQLVRRQLQRPASQANLLERCASSFRGLGLDGGAARSPGPGGTTDLLASPAPGALEGSGPECTTAGAAATASPAPSRGSSSRMLKPSVLSVARQQLANILASSGDLRPSASSASLADSSRG